MLDAIAAMCSLIFCRSTGTVVPLVAMGIISSSSHILASEDLPICVGSLKFTVCELAGFGGRFAAPAPVGVVILSLGLMYFRGNVTLSVRG
jgi:hypothetical protein